MIRLREPEDSSSFLPWESILGTMLHELCHIAIGAHSADFYKLLDELWTEIESSNTNLWSGSNKTSAVGPSYSFDGAYRKLGSGSSAPSKDLKRLAAEAALKRQAFNAVSCSSSGSGGYRLGGAPLPSSSSSSSSSDWKNQAIAAAERRRLDDVACDSDANATLPQKSQNDVGAEGWICEVCLEENTTFPKASGSCYFCGGLTQAEKKEYSLFTPNESTETISIPPTNKSRGILMKRQTSAEICLPCPNPRSSGTSESISGKRLKGPSKADIVDLTSSAEPTPRSTERERIDLECLACTFINSVAIGDVSSSCEICGTRISFIGEEP